MFTYLQKFNNLPKELRDKFSSPAIMAIINNLEKKYSVNLAPTIMRIAVKELNINKLSQYFINQFALDNKTVDKLSNELKGLFLKIKSNNALQNKIILKKNNNNKISIYPAKSMSFPEPLTMANLLPPALPTVLLDKTNNSGVDNVINKNLTTDLQKAAFFFSTEDEEEVRELLKKNDKKFDNKILNNNIDSKLNNIIQQIHVDLNDQNLLNRLKQILKTYILGIRNEIDIKQTLMKSVENGGLGLNNELIDKILIITKNIEHHSAVETQQVESEQNINQQSASFKTIKARDIDYDLTVLKNKKNIFNKSQKKESNSQLGNSEHRIASSIQSKRSGSANNKKIIEDIKHVSKIMDPVDELRYLNLINFQRLGPNPYKATEIIINRINLLEEEQYIKKIHGIQAWRQSPTNKLYLKIGTQGLNERESIEAVLKKRKKNNQDFLTLEEFTAIADMNKHLNI